jgi:hypothetical protein
LQKVFSTSKVSFARKRLREELEERKRNDKEKGAFCMHDLSSGSFLGWKGLVWALSSLFWLATKTVVLLLLLLLSISYISVFGFNRV